MTIKMLQLQVTISVILVIGSVADCISYQVTYTQVASFWLGDNSKHLC